MKFLSTLHDLKAETDDKDDEGYGLRRELAKAKNELDSLENVRAKLTRAQDDLEDKNDKLIVVTSQKQGIEKKLNKLLKEMDQLKEDHELELTSLLNQLYLEKSIINLEKKEESKYVSQTHTEEKVDDRELHNHQGQGRDVHDTPNPPGDLDPAPLVCRNNNAVTQGPTAIQKQNRNQSQM